MKILKRAFALSLLGLLAACGGGSDTANTTGASQCQSGYTYTTQSGCVLGTATGAYGTVCSDGQLNSTTYGCMARANCQAGFGLPTSGTNNNSCQPASQTGSCSGADVYSPLYGCIPQAGCGSGQGSYNGSCTAAYNSSNQYNNNGGYQGPGGAGGYFPGNNNNGGNNCPVNTYNTVAGCLSQGPCNPGQVLYQNQCLNLIAPGSNGGGGIGFHFHLGF
jgi:hypothetical protein